MATSPTPMAHAATVAILPLAALASVSGLLAPDLYTGNGALAPAMRGQDLLTLLTLPILAAALAGARRESARALLIWLGLLGYQLYTYTGAAFAYRFNPLFLVYVALFALSALALGAGIAGIDAPALQRQFDPRTPRRALAAFLAAVALMLAVSELGQIVPALLSGSVPALVARSNGGGNFVYVLDLGVIAPLAVAGAVGLLRRTRWADVLASLLTIKAATMGLALLAMTAVAARANQPIDVALTVAYAAIAASGLAMTLWFLAHVRSARPATVRKDDTWKGKLKDKNAGRSTPPTPSSASRCATSW